MSRNKIPLDVLIESLLNESSQQIQETVGLKWEWEHYIKLEGLISKIREREFQRDSTSAECEDLNNLKVTTAKEDVEESSENKRRSKHFQKFMDWLNEHGVNPQSVKISHINPVAGYGLRATSPLKNGEVVFKIPKKVIITSIVARESKLKIVAEKDPLLSGMQNVLLAMFLVYERYVNPDSFWKPYINILPQTFDTIVYFNKDEMTVLKNSPTAFREALRMLRNVARQYAYFHTKFRKATDSASRALKTVFTYNRYVWGVSAVTTRINHLPNANGESILSLIPLWDFCNHEPTELLCTDYNEVEETLVCYAGHDYEKNSEFTIFYGRRSSVDFLVHNGFVPPNFHHDFYHLELGIGMNDLNYNRKKAILAKIGLECQSTFPVKPEILTEVKKLFAFVRIFQADKDFLTEVEGKLEDLTFLEETTDSCWKFLAARFLILQKAAENSLAATMKNLYGENQPKNLSRVTTILLQLLKNEQKVLEMLSHCAHSQLNKTNSH